MHRFQAHARRARSWSALFATASMLGCASNIGTVKSSQGEQVQPKTDPSAVAHADLATAAGGAGQGKRDTRLEVVALFPGPEQPAGVAVSRAGRVFLSFPRWADPVKDTLV